MPNDQGEDLSLREEILVAFKESEAAEAEPDTHEASSEAAQQSAPPKESEDTAKAETPAKADEASAKDDPSGADGKADAKDGIEPPARWTKEEKEEFASLDPEVQRILMTRNKGLEASYTKKMMEVAQERQRYSGIDQALAPHRQSWAGTGWDDATALQNIMGYWQHAQADPMGFLSRFAEERGIDLASQFAPSTDEILAYLNQNGGVDGEGNPLPQQGQALHPDVARRLQTYEQRINQLQQAVTQQQGYVSHTEQQRQAQELDRARNELDAFINATDETGRSKHEFYDELRPEMIKLMEAGVTETLEDAYQRALWGNESTRQKLFESQEIQRRRDAERKQQEEAERARRASSSVAGASVGTAAASDDGDDDSVRGILLREMNRASRSASGLI